MRSFLDENFPKAVTGLLVSLGHEVDDIRGTDREGSADVTIFQMAQMRSAAFLTTDRDFFHTVPLTVPQHYGVVVVALHQPNRARILGRIDWFMERFGKSGLRNRVYELRDRTYVVSSNPSGGPEEEEPEMARS